MRNLSKEFENRAIDYDKLLNYGFVKKDEFYLYEKKICDGDFKVIIEISSKAQTSKVIDLFSDDEYVLVDIKNSFGEVVGKVREEYENILNDIVEKCSRPDVFKSNQAKMIIAYIREKYGDELEYLWKKFPSNAIWRNKNNNKWYGILLVIPESKLNINSEKIIEIIDLRYQREDIGNIIDKENIFPGYHMNKNSWISIRLDGSMNIEEIYKFIDNSFCLSLNK